MLSNKSNQRTPPINQFKPIARRGRVRRYQSELAAVVCKARRTENPQVLGTALSIISRPLKTVTEILAGGERQRLR